MIRAGDSLVNPVTGEQLVFERTARDTNGEYTRFETIVAPGGKVASAHVHPYQTELFTVNAGTPSAFAFESLIETMFALAADGKTNRKGMPNPLRLAVIAKHHFDVARLPVVPHSLQRAALVPGALLGRALGYARPTRPASASLSLRW
jgi:hypothetical protein